MNSSKPQEVIEITVGLILLFFSWSLILIIAIDILALDSPETKIIASILCYALSVIGLALSSHGLFTRISIKKMKKDREH
ncbi:MAG: hypothetical protein QXW05_02910 [Ignisphaera sp.]